jgi:hypothetical protein
MNTPDLTQYINAFRSHSCEPPKGYIWAAQQGMIGFHEFSQFQPWQFCGVEEIVPLHQRWPSFKGQHVLIPFARRQDCDELACFKLDRSEIVGINVIHYSLGASVTVEICEEYSNFWDWVRGIIKDIELWSGLSDKSGA